MEKVKNKIILLVVGALLVVGGYSVKLANELLSPQAKLQGVSGQAWIVNKKLNNVASTTAKYLTPNATTTIESSFSTIDADALNVKVQVIASTTGLINFVFEGSDNGVDWYDMTCLSSTLTNSIRVYDAGPCMHTFSMATSSLTVASNYVLKSFVIEPIIFEKMRVKVSPTTDATIWTNIGIRQPKN